jgi:hypothetical protein
LAKAAVPDLLAFEQQSLIVKDDAYSPRFSRWRRPFRTALFHG